MTDTAPAATTTLESSAPPVPETEHKFPLLQPNHLQAQHWAHIGVSRQFAMPPVAPASGFPYFHGRLRRLWECGQTALARVLQPTDCPTPWATRVAPNPPKPPARSPVPSRHPKFRQAYPIPPRSSPHPRRRASRSRSASRPANEKRRCKASPFPHVRVVG